MKFIVYSYTSTKSFIWTPVIYTHPVRNFDLNIRLSALKTTLQDVRLDTKPLKNYRTKKK